MGAAADCEAIGTGFFGQPINALTTLAFVVAGVIVIAQRRDMPWIGIGLIATGLGSFLFHGPMPPGNEWAHDVTLAWLVTLVAGWENRWEKLSRLPALAVIGALFAVVPVLADPFAVVMTVIAVISILRHGASSAVAPMSLLGTVAVFGRLGATGGPLCDPGAIFQPHAVWHLGAAIAVAWWALARVDRQPTRRSKQ